MVVNVKTSWNRYWTSGRVMLKHVALALAVVILIYVLYTFFRKNLPSPDVLSPFAYLIAFIASFVSYWRIENKKSARFSLFVLVLTGLAFMDEISYGVEPGFVNAIYVEKYNVYIYDLHNLIGLIIELTQIFIKENEWNIELFAKFMQIDLIAILISVVYIAVLRIGQKTKDSQGQILFLFVQFLFFSGIISVLSLALLPADPKNAWLFVFSKSRIALMATIFLFSSMPLVFLTYLKRKSGARGLTITKLQELISTENSLKRLRLIGYGIIVAVLVYEFWTPFITYPDQKVIVDRITPIVALSIFTAILFLTVVQGWKGKLTRPMKSYLEPFQAFVNANPSLIYAVTAVVIIIIAQINDKSWVVLGDMFAFPSVGISDWGWWTEEVFEFTAAIEFYFASLFFKKIDKNIA
jgi:hypothetical protein